MADPIAGRRLVLASLLTILALSLGLAFLGASTSTVAVRYGRPLAVALACVLVWQGRSWARWLLILLGLGILLAGPIAMGNGVSPLTLAGVGFWLASVLYAASLVILFVSPGGRAHPAAPPSARPQLRRESSGGGS